MSILPKLLGASSLCAWAYLAFFRGRFWRSNSVAPPQLDARATALPEVIVLVPARNEAANIKRCVESVLRQDYAGKLNLVVIDDNSSDGTAELATQAAHAAGAIDRFRLVHALSPPPGWTGKLWALSEGLRELSNPDYFLFTDADIEHDAKSVGELVARAEAGKFDLVSLMVKLRCETLAERALVPAFVFFFFMLYPPAWVAGAQRKTAAAAGGCILIRPGALRRIGGFRAIRGELIDDCALAKRVKATGGRIWLGLTENTISLREYGSWREIEQMISRTAFTQLRYSPVLLAAAVAGLLLTLVAPPVLLFAGSSAAAMGFAAWLLMAICFWPTLRFYRRSPLWAPF